MHGTPLRHLHSVIYPGGKVSKILTSFRSLDRTKLWNKWLRYQTLFALESHTRYCYPSFSKNIFHLSCLYIVIQVASLLIYKLQKLCSNFLAPQKRHKSANHLQINDVTIRASTQTKTSFSVPSNSSAVSFASFRWIYGKQHDVFIPKLSKSYVPRGIRWTWRTDLSRGYVSVERKSAMD